MIFVAGFIDDDGYFVTTGVVVGDEQKAKSHAIKTTPPDIEFCGPIVEEFHNNGTKAYEHRYRNGVWQWQAYSQSTK